MQLEVVATPTADTVSEVQPYRIWRIIFSFPVALVALLILLTVVTARSRFSDPDLWYHLKIGEIIWNTHSLPRFDLFSFTAYGYPWIPQEWLSQLVIYGAYKLAGYTGLMLWLCVVPSLLIISEYVLCSLYSGNAKVAFVGALLVWLCSTVGFAVRPHMIGYLLLVCELIIVQLGRTRDSRFFYALPPLFALWINCHGSFFFGLVVLAVILFCSFLEVQWGLLVSRRLNKRGRNALTIASVLSLVALFVNPIGLKLVMSPITVMAKLPVNLTQVEEWLPPHFDEIRGLTLLAVTGVIVLLPLLRRTELTIQDLLLTILGFGFAVLHERMIFIFGILAAPVLCGAIADLWDRYDRDRDHPILNTIFIGASLLIAVWIFPSVNNLELQVREKNPVKALEYLRKSGFAGRMLNEYVFGGYLIWAAPQYKVFVDGRGDIFESTGVLTQYGDFIMVHANPRVLLDKYRIDRCLLSPEDPVSHVLPLLPEWKIVYSDNLAKIFARYP